MDLNLFPPEPASNSFIQKGDDPAKYDAIAAKLCDKRRALERTLESPDLSLEAKEQAALDLIQSKQDMLLFGVTEVDYQAYVAKTESEARTPQEQNQAPQKPATPPQGEVLNEDISG